MKIDLTELTQLEKQKYDNVHWKGSFEQYLEICKSNSNVYGSAFQRLHNMILSHGVEEREEFKEKIKRYKFFDDPFENGRDAVFGIDKNLMEFIDLVEAGANRYGVENRILLLHGPVGTAKSTIARLLKKGLEAYSRTEEGQLYTFRWKNLGEIDEVVGDSDVDCPLHEEPLHLIPKSYREKHGFGDVEGGLCPLCNYYYEELMNKYDGDFQKVLSHIEVFRYTLSEDKRLGIATFQPKDEKNQDSTELTGDIDYRKIAEYGRDSDPRAFNFDGEFNVANRGMIEMIEALKLDVAFLYDLLTASQEHKIKPKKFAHVDIDEVILSHTNEPEFLKLQKDERMEALRDRIVRINIPYILNLDEEVKIYEKQFAKVKKHVAPHTFEVASIWAILTRLDPPEGDLTLIQKMKLYNGKSLPGFTIDGVKELKEKAEKEGMSGIGPRYIIDKISNAIVKHPDRDFVSPFIVLNELENGLDNYSLINDKSKAEEYKKLLRVVGEEYKDIIKSEVQKAIAGDKEGLKRLCANYVDNLRAYVSNEKVKDKITGKDQEPNEKLMREIESKIGIPEDRKDDFRSEIMKYIGNLALDNKKFEYDSNERLLKAFELKLFEDQKDTIKLQSLVSGSVVPSDTQEKIDIVKKRLVDEFGYNDSSAQEVLQYVASVFARSDSKE